MTTPAAAKLTEDLAAAGFLCLGGFEPGAGDGVPDISGGSAVTNLLLIGSTGPSLWPSFRTTPEFADPAPHALDRYTKRALSQIAADHRYEVLFPFEGPPYFPFQQWALKCGGFSQSPLGVLAHAQYGPWTGFRAAFLTSEPVIATPAPTVSGPCETCFDKPCVTACPVDAISPETGYDVPACKTHLASDPAIACWSGCLARHACPYGGDHKPSPETARFHMESFVGLWGADP